MFIGSYKISSVPTSSFKHDRFDLEPDDAWKDALGERIGEGVISMMGDTTRARDNQLASIPPNDPRQEKIWEDYDNTMQTIVNLAKQVFQVELERERQERRRWNSQATIHRRAHGLKSEQQQIMDRVKEMPKESSSPVTTLKGLDEIRSVESSHVDEDRPASRKAITKGTFGPPIIEATDHWAPTATPERRKQELSSRSESQSAVPDRQHDESSSYSRPSSSGGQRSDVMGRPPPKTSNSQASVSSLQDRDPATHPLPVSKASLDDDRVYLATAYHASGRPSDQPEQRSVSWQGAIQPPTSPPQRWPSEIRPATSLVDYLSHSAPEGLSICSETSVCS